jgi:hypothetical protein
VFKHLDEHLVGGKLRQRRFNQRKLAELRQRQIDAVKYLDTVVEELFDLVPRNTYITIASDHGELFGEDGFFGHGPPVSHPIFAYIGPGAGFAFLGSFLTLALSFLASVASLLLWPFRMMRMILRRRRSAPARVKKLILTEKWMAEGKMPNLARLKRQGSYRRLRTTCPPLLPVAWSTFATGVNPAKHNIFDFLNRDLRTYAPELSSAKVRPAQRVLRIGKFEIPLERPSVEMRRKSEPFWKILDRSGVESTILRVPVTFPPDNFNGRLLSAMSTPDLRGSQGTFSLFTSPEGALEGPENAEPIPFRAFKNILEIQFSVSLAEDPQPTPVILISIDTLRADHLSAYGYRKIKTPHIDSFADTVFTDVNSQIPLTLPSHTSPFTSTYPFENGIEENAAVVPAGAVTLASILHSHGYKTAAFVGSNILDRHCGLDQGFDDYDSPFGAPSSQSNPYSSRVRRDGALVLRAANAWLAEHRNQPVFVFVHLFDLHPPIS